MEWSTLTCELCDDVESKGGVVAPLIILGVVIVLAIVAWLCRGCVPDDHPANQMLQRMMDAYHHAYRNKIKLVVYGAMMRARGSRLLRSRATSL